MNRNTAAIWYVLMAPDTGEIVPQLFASRAEARTEREISELTDMQIRRAKLVVFDR